MEDLWRVKDVLDAIKRHKERVAPEPKKGPVAEGYRMACDHITELLCRCVPTVQRETESKWIPVKERLPEDHTRCLIYHNCGGKYGGIRSSLYCNGRFLALYEGEKITHWMPLPEPPKQKGNSDG